MIEQTKILAEIRDAIVANTAVQTRIADALEAVLLPLPSASEAAPPACTHPHDERIDFGVTNGVEDFQCKVCGFRPDTTRQEVGAHHG